MQYYFLNIISTKLILLCFSIYFVMKIFSGNLISRLPQKRNLLIMKLVATYILV